MHRISQRSTPSTVLALFDSRIDDLKLPVLQFGAMENHGRSSRVEEIPPLVQNYFQWTAVFSSG
ncbi:hypothetical protein L218DRAFT_954625 [Marasmius fiardii PR-910]|nr:hypothetical protein L218DRAFT_954625 [Marasmius fiardii PR-910]